MKNKYEKVNITIGYANSLKAKEKKYLVSDQMPGLCLKVEPTEHKSWVYYYRAKGRPVREMNLGSLATISPAKARELVKTVCTGEKVTLYHPNLLALVWVKLTYFY